MSCRASIALVLCLAMSGTLGLASRPGAGTRDRDRAVRLTRSGFFRFDSPDAVLHSHEETNPEAAPSSLVVGQPSIDVDRGAAPDAPHVVAIATPRVVYALPLRGASSACLLPPSPEHGASVPGARPPGRAPPLAA